MKKSTKAALLSGLVFPGAGHLYLKRWWSGILLCGVAAYALYFIISLTMAIAGEVLEKVESGAVSSDIDTLTVMVSRQLSGSEHAMNLASTAFAICWIIGIVSSFWLGRAQDGIAATAR